MAENPILLNMIKNTEQIVITARTQLEHLYELARKEKIEVIPIEKKNEIFSTYEKE